MTDAAPLADATARPQATTPDPPAAAQPAPAASAESQAPDTTADEPAAAAEGPAAAAEGPAGAGPRRARRRIPFAHAVRVPPPRVLARRTAHATREWSKAPSGRFALPGLFLLALVASAATAGALVIPAATEAPHPIAATATPSAGWFDSAQPTPPGTVPTGPVATGSPLPGGTLPGAGAPTGRPADALAAWAQQTGRRVGIPAVAMQAYGYAELVLQRTNPSCGLTWTTLAAIGYVESRHGSANGAVLGADGQALPKIIGEPLDGQGGRQRITDTDRGEIDGDTTYDRAVGPMQFIPSTWREIGADADNDGLKNPHDIDDAALAAGNYLCKGGRNLTIPGDWWNAILSYNDVRRYAQDVFDTANRYGLASRT